MLDLQDELQTRYTGGTVVHLFVGEEITNPASVAELVQRDLRALPPALLHHHPDLQHLPEPRLPARASRRHCPNCGAVSEVYSRVVGYLRPVNQWNEGKVEEFKQRKTFKIEQGVAAVKEAQVDADGRHR